MSGVGGLGFWDLGFRVQFLILGIKVQDSRLGGLLD